MCSQKEPASFKNHLQALTFPPMTQQGIITKISIFFPLTISYLWRKEIILYYYTTLHEVTWLDQILYKYLMLIGKQ